MLTLRQRIATLAALPGAALAIFLLALFGRKPVPTEPVAPLEARFDAQAAVEYTRVLAEDYPDRVTGSPGATRAAAYLRAEFIRLGYHVTDDHFTMWLAGRQVEGDNVIAEVSGREPASVPILAHYDSQTTSHQAAEDNASGVGVLLELARVLATERRQRALILVATDAEEWGMIGARHLAGYLRSRHPVAAISIDYLNRGQAPALGIDCMGQGGGYTPLWLRELMVKSGQAQGVPVVGPTPTWEFVERALEVSAQDQGPLVRSGIPALNISTLTKDYAGSRARYHTTQDVFQNFDPESFRMLGATVEEAVVTLDGLRGRAGVPPESTDRDASSARGRQRLGAVGMDYWQISSTAYLPGRIVRLMMLAGLVPVLLAGAFAAWNFALGRVLPAGHAPPRMGPARSGWMLLRPLVYLIPGVLALTTLYVLTATNVLTRYELYPATPKDPFLYQLPPRVVAPLVIALLAGYGIIRVVRGKIPPPASFASTKQILYLWLWVVVLGAFFLNPFAMWLYLGLFAYGARWLHPPRNTRSRVINAVVLALGALPFAALLYSFGKETFLGWRIIWYIVLQTAYGVWSPWAAVVFLMAAALWIQFLRACLGKFAAPPGASHPDGR